MKLRSKLLAAFIVATLVLVAAVFFLLRWTFERGAETYMRQQEQEQLVELAADLANYYAEYGSWQAFAVDRGRWLNWLRVRQTGLPPDLRSEPPERQSQWQDDHRHRMKPFYLLDASQQPVAGKASREGLRVPISRQLTNGIDTVVGYVGLPPPSHPHSFRKTPLASRQQQLMAYFAIGALLISVVVAIPLSSRLSRRILALHQYVASLTQGDYKKRVSVSGNDEIATLADYLNQLAQSLDDTQRQRRQMTADISHELRTPVATLQANIEALQDDVIPLTPEALRQLHAQVLRLSSLIDDLYRLSLADAGAWQFNMGATDLTATLSALVSAYQTVFQQQGLSLILKSTGADDVRVWGDEQRLKQLFINLLENSRRYTHSQGEVLIEISQHNDTVQVTISDSAPGVEKTLQPRLTDRLFRVEASRGRDSGGAGLGLNVCAAIVAAHHGSLAFDDSPLGGLAVVVTLPKAGEV